MARWSAFKWVHHTPLYCYWATVGHRRPPFYLALNRASHRSNIVGPPSRKGVLWVAGTQQTRSQSIGVITEQLHGFRPLYANKHPKDNVLQNYLSGIPPPPPPVKVEGRDSSFSPPNIDCWGRGGGRRLNWHCFRAKKESAQSSFAKRCILEAHSEKGSRAAQPESAGPGSLIVTRAIHNVTWALENPWGKCVGGPTQRHKEPNCTKGPIFQA